MADLRCGEKRCQFLDDPGHGLLGLPSDRGRRFSVNHIDKQLLAQAIKGRIDPTNKVTARQNGHDVVPKPPFIFGGVDFALRAKVEEAGGSLAITDVLSLDVASCQSQDYPPVVDDTGVFAASLTRVTIVEGGKSFIISTFWFHDKVENRVYKSLQIDSLALFHVFLQPQSIQY